MTKDISKESMANVSLGRELNMRILARDIQERLGNQVGFTLLVFPLNTVSGQMSYISTTKRQDMLAALKDVIAQLENNEDMPAAMKGEQADEHNS